MVKDNLVMAKSQIMAKPAKSFFLIPFSQIS